MLNIFVPISGQSQNWTKKKYKFYSVKSWKTHRTIKLPTERLHALARFEWSQHHLAHRLGLRRLRRRTTHKLSLHDINFGVFFNPPVARGRVSIKNGKRLNTCLHCCHVFWPGGGRVLPSNRLMGMCSWMRSHFHDWIDYHGVAFLTGMGSHIVRILGVRKFRYVGILK